MSLAAFLAGIVRILEEVQVPYMLTGSLAAAYYANPRATQDVDLVIELTGDQIDSLVAGFSAADLYVSRDAAREAFRTTGQFNVIDPESGWKADLIVRKNRRFSEVEFGRRRPRCLAWNSPSPVRKTSRSRSLKGAYSGILNCSAVTSFSCSRVWARHSTESTSTNWVSRLGLESAWRTVLDRLEN